MIAVERDGVHAPPRRNGELVFEAPWQGRAFGLCIALLERDGLSWDDFRPHLVAAVVDAPDAPYYESFVTALEALVDEHHSGVGGAGTAAATIKDHPQRST